MLRFRTVSLCTKNINRRAEIQQVKLNKALMASITAKLHIIMKYLFVMLKFIVHIMLVIKKTICQIGLLQKKTMTVKVMILIQKE